MKTDPTLGALIKRIGACGLRRRLDLKALKEYPADEVMRQLVAVKGIGRWTAEIYLMFRLGRPEPSAIGRQPDDQLRTTVPSSEYATRKPMLYA